MLQKNIKRTRDKQVSMKISVRCNQNEFMLTYIHTYIHCLQVAISTPDGRSWGYPYITLKYLSLITYTQPKKRSATTLGSTSPAPSEQQCRFFYIPQELYIKWNCCEKTRKFSLQISFKGSTFSSVILRWVTVQLGFEPVVSHSADGRSPKWANHVVYLAGGCNWRGYHVP